DTGIAFPFTPGRNHRAPSRKTSEMRQFSSIDPANEQRLCWNLNALLQKIGDGNRGEITLSWMVKPVTDRGDRPPRIVASCCSFAPDRPLTLPTPLQPSLPITRSRHRRRSSAAACGIARPGGRSLHFHKNQKRE